MNRLQWIVTGATIALFFVLYFGCDTKPKKMQALETTRAMTAESTDLNSLLQTAQAKLDVAKSSEITDLERAVETATTDTARVEALKQLSGKWYSNGEPAIAGTYAQQVAELLNDEQSWSVTGTTYAICLQNTQEEQVRSYCVNRAVKAFENAISVNPNNTTHRVNLALVYTDAPPQDEPMKGILMLRELNQQQPDNVLILNNLARLAMKTNQWDRAKERLERATTLEPDNMNTVCMLAQVYEQLGETEKAEPFTQRCKTATINN